MNADPPPNVHKKGVLAPVEVGPGVVQAASLAAILTPGALAVEGVVRAIFALASSRAAVAHPAVVAVAIVSAALVVMVQIVAIGVGVVVAVVVVMVVVEGPAVGVVAEGVATTQLASPVEALLVPALAEAARVIPRTFRRATSAIASFSAAAVQPVPAGAVELQPVVVEDVPVVVLPAPAVHALLAIGAIASPVPRGAEVPQVRHDALAAHANLVPAAATAPPIAPVALLVAVQHAPAQAASSAATLLAGLALAVSRAPLVAFEDDRVQVRARGSPAGPSAAVEADGEDDDE